MNPNPISHPDLTNHILVPIAYFDRLMRLAYGHAPDPVGRGRMPGGGGPQPDNSSPTLASTVTERLPREWKRVTPEKPAHGS
jgi:hypothetical protein